MSTLEIFGGRYQGSDFRHAVSLFSDIQTGACLLREGSGNSVPCSHLLRTHLSRAKHLEKYTSAYAKSVHEDVIALCEGLAKSPPSERIRFWIFTKSPYDVYCIFEAETAQEIVGCVLSADQRLVPPDIWDVLWNQWLI